MFIRLDRAGTSARLGATPIEVTPEGFKVYRGTAAFGDVVYEYPEKGRNEYVPAAEALAPDIVASIVGKPFTIHHPDDLLTADEADSIKEHVEGTVRAARANLEVSPPELEVEVVVWTRPAQEEIESGAVVELSPGYFCEEDDAPGGSVGPGGKPFSKIQRRRRYNHLSGVMRARGVTPDGRRARLDGVAADSPPRIVTGHAVALDAAPPDGVYLADWPGPFITAAYPHTDATEYDMDPNLAEAAPPIPPADALPVAAPADMDPAEALAMFSPEAAEILKTLPAEDMAILQRLALGEKAEAAEAAVIAAGEGEAAGIVAEDAPKVEIEVESASEGEEETEGVEGGSPLPEDDAAPMMLDAPPPAVPTGATAPVTHGDLAAAIDTLGNKMIEMMQAAMAASTKAAKTDAKPPAPVVKPKADAATARADAERTADEAAFLATVKKAGHRVDSYPEAAAKAVAVVKDHASPALAGLAAAAAKEGRRATLLALFEDAENRRRDALIGEQFNSLRLVVDAEDNYRQGVGATTGTRKDADAPLPAYLPIPGAARAGK